MVANGQHEPPKAAGHMGPIKCVKQSKTLTWARPFIAYKFIFFIKKNMVLYPLDTTTLSNYFISKPQTFEQIKPFSLLCLTGVMCLAHGLMASWVCVRRGGYPTSFLWSARSWTLWPRPSPFRHCLLLQTEAKAGSSYWANDFLPSHASWEEAVRWRSGVNRFKISSHFTCCCPASGSRAHYTSCQTPAG